MKWLSPAVMVRAVDGDTLVVDIDLGFRVWLRGQHVRLVAWGAGDRPVRYDAPELTGPKASKEGRDAREWLMLHNPPGSTFEIQTFKGSETDKYGRWLAVVWLDPDGHYPESDLARVMASQGIGYLSE